MEPKTPEEWQEAVDSAQFFLLFDSARQYGLVTGGPGVNSQRCADVLKRGRELGYSPAAVDKLCSKYLEKTP